MDSIFSVGNPDWHAPGTPLNANPAVQKIWLFLDRIKPKLPETRVIVLKVSFADCGLWSKGASTSFADCPCSFNWWQEATWFEQPVGRETNTRRTLICFVFIYLSKPQNSLQRNLALIQDAALRKKILSIDSDLWIIFDFINDLHFCYQFHLPFFPLTSHPIQILFSYNLCEETATAQKCLFSSVNLV